MARIGFFAVGKYATSEGGSWLAHLARPNYLTIATRYSSGRDDVHSTHLTPPLLLLYLLQHCATNSMHFTVNMYEDQKNVGWRRLTAHVVSKRQRLFTPDILDFV